MIREIPRSLFGLLCAIALTMVLGCAPTEPDEALTVASLAAKRGISLPPEGTGPIKAFSSIGAQTPGDRRIHDAWLEWPDGTEVISGRTYLRTRIVTIGQGKRRYPDFRYRRYDGDTAYAIDKQHLDFGEYSLGPRKRAIGQRWTTTDATERWDCEVVQPVGFSLNGKAYSSCYRVRCSTTTRMPDGVTFEGEDLFTECSGIGTVHLVATSSHGEIRIEIENRLVDLLANGVTLEE